MTPALNFFVLSTTAYITMSGSFPSVGSTDTDIKSSGIQIGMKFFKSTCLMHAQLLSSQQEFTSSQTF